MYYIAAAASANGSVAAFVTSLSIERREQRLRGDWVLGCLKLLT